jgi:hypothetical protein
VRSPESIAQTQMYLAASGMLKDPVGEALGLIWMALHTTATRTGLSGSWHGCGSMGGTYDKTSC